MKWPLAFLVAIYVLAVVGLAVFQRRLLYFPDRRLTHPAEAGISGVEELRLVTDDGEMLVAWHLPPRKGQPLRANPAPFRSGLIVLLRFAKNDAARL